MLELLLMCAPAVAPITMAAVIKQESGGKPWVIYNNTTKKSATFDSKVIAVAAATAAIDHGDSVDMGLAQINSRNLPSLGLSVDQVFDPCTNIAAGAAILAAGFQRTGSLNGALSTYNTGRPDSKIGADYAQKVYGQAGVKTPDVKVPAIPGGQLAKLPETLPFNTNQMTQSPIRLLVTPAPSVAGLSPARAASNSTAQSTLWPAQWR
jgi:type IV secretion system protein VirB1